MERLVPVEFSIQGTPAGGQQPRVVENITGALSKGIPRNITSLPCKALPKCIPRNVTSLPSKASKCRGISHRKPVSANSLSKVSDSHKTCWNEDMLVDIYGHLTLTRGVVVSGRPVKCDKVCSGSRRTRPSHGNNGTLIPSPQLITSEPRWDASATPAFVLEQRDFRAVPSNAKRIPLRDQSWGACKGEVTVLMPDVSH